MNSCPFCLGPSFHPSCAERFHGSATIPIVDVESSSHEEIIGKQAEKIGGVQRKFLAEVSDDGARLIPRAGGRFIVKLPWKKARGLRPRAGGDGEARLRRTSERKHLPQNEHLSMCLARLLGIEVAPCALLSQIDGTLVYVTKRFDRLDEFDADSIRSRYMLDFCQLLDLHEAHKYGHAASRCVQVIVENSINVNADLEKLFRLFLFCYWISNGDLHLKNLSLIDRAGLRLAPAYDLASGYVFGNENEKLALPVRGRERDIPRREWLAFAAECRLDESKAAAVIDAMLARYDDCVAMIRRSGLPQDHRPAYLRCLTKRRRALGGPR